MSNKQYILWLLTTKYSVQFTNTFNILHFIAYIIVYYDYVMHEILVPVSCGNSLDKLLLQLFPFHISLWY